MTFISELLIVIISDFHFQNIPFVPPPPPPIGEDGVDGDNEAMCSMLMAWYMSGYHTGYYQVQFTISSQNVHIQNVLIKISSFK